MATCEWSTIDTSKACFRARPGSRLFEVAGLKAAGDLDEWGRDVFLARKP